MVKAGVPVDAVLTELAPLLDPGDIVVDGGNSYFRDTERREAELAAQNLHLRRHGRLRRRARRALGTEPDARRPARGLRRPRADARRHRRQERLRSLRQLHRPRRQRSLRQDDPQRHRVRRHAAHRRDPTTSCAPRSACRPKRSPTVFADWNTRALASYLIEVTADVLRYIDTETGQPLVDLILDAAEQKGTGRWTIESALELASPVPTIDAAVTARNLSALRGLRVQASEVLLGPTPPGGPEQAAAVARRSLTARTAALAALEDALYFSKISSYAQGMALLKRGERRL